MYATIKVYKTDVSNRYEASLISDLLLNELKHCDVSFDLEDVDKVLRIESFNGVINEEKVKRILMTNGHIMEPLPF